MSSSFWLDDIIIPDKKSNKEPKPTEYAFASDTVIINEADQKSYLVDCNESAGLQLQIDTAEGPRTIPISGQHVITTADGQQFLAGGVLPEEQQGYLHSVEGGQTFVLSTETGGQQIYQDSSGQQYIICDIASPEGQQAQQPPPEDTFTNIDSFISKGDRAPSLESDKPTVKLPSGTEGEYITYEIDCQLEEGSEPLGDKNILDQEKLANLLNVLQTGEHGHALSNADLFILAPPEQHQSESAQDFSKPELQYSADTGDIITNLKPESAEPIPTKYVAVKMKKSDLNVNNNAASAKIKDKECVINSNKKTNRKITEFGEGYVKSKAAAEESKADWEYSVWAGSASQSTSTQGVKRKRGPPKKSDKSDPKQAKLEQMTLDVGQNIEPIQCAQCGMIYSQTVSEDEQNHNKYHKRFLKASSFSGWKTERVVEEYHDGRIILVNQHDPKAHIKKMDEVREVVDIDLGITDRSTSASPVGRDLQAFLYISNANKVIAAAFVEHIEKGYPCISAHEPDESGKLPLMKAGEMPMKAVCGISRLWVFKQCRRKKIASRLMDCVRANFVFGCTIGKVKIAFSDPTEAGRSFAQTYCGSPNFLIYR